MLRAEFQTWGVIYLLWSLLIKSADLLELDCPNNSERKKEFGQSLLKAEMCLVWKQKVQKHGTLITEENAKSNKPTQLKWIVI